MKSMDPLPGKKCTNFACHSGCLAPMKLSTDPFAVWQISSTLTVLLVEETFAKGNLTSSSKSPYTSQRPGNETPWAQIGQTPSEDQGRKVFSPKS